ncbi:MAG: BON domain-containing protein [Candidatus Peribacteraceae bacterium]|nr:BON domain-containing protein [Candidatus Peribacteraceae bacterium]MDD5075219.1 BON domain-containing protein [Candidatus Peribacteraceae bacterium]
MNKTPAPAEAPISPVPAHGSHALVPVEDHLHEIIHHQLKSHSALFTRLNISVEDGVVSLSGPLDSFSHKALLIAAIRGVTAKRALTLDASGVKVPARQQEAE